LSLVDTHQLNTYTCLFNLQKGQASAERRRQTMEVSTKNYYYKSWEEAFSKIDVEGMIETIIESVTENIEESWKPKFPFHILKFIIESLVYNDDFEPILPYPKLMLKAFEQPVSSIRIVILGQDPYHSTELGQYGPIPQAMGLSFSVPIGIKVPPSLMNIYKNLIKFGHLSRMPSHGNLEKIQSQGVMFLNSALTVFEKKPNSHQRVWRPFTTKILQELDSENITFVLWGKDAIDRGTCLKESRLLCSSHPSGLSCHKPCGKYPSFMDFDFAKDLGIDWNVLIN